ncbi:MAG: ribosome recycling factor [Candidatus Aceula meridiana]|nr:ribosome recycling factor [Candidatus Aceula meridiana]
MAIKEFIHQIEDKMKKTIQSVSREFAEVRTGRAHPGLIEGLHADYYGTPTMIKQVASITVPDAKTVLIQPWDPGAIEPIEKAITNSKLGIMPSNDGKMIRLNIPSLSRERRDELVRVVKDMAEKGRVSVRSIRREANDKIKKFEQDKTISEDDGFLAHDQVQKLTDKYIKEVEGILEAKDKELEDFGK